MRVYNVTLIQMHEATLICCEAYFGQHYLVVMDMDEYLLTDSKFHLVFRQDDPNIANDLEGIVTFLRSKGELEYESKTIRAFRGPSKIAMTIAQNYDTDCGDSLSFSEREVLTGVHEELANWLEERICLFTGRFE